LAIAEKRLTFSMLHKSYLLIFGGGQDAYYISKLCKETQLIPILISRSRHIDNGVIGDVSNWDNVLELVRQYKPAYIFHLAANSTTRHEALFENHETISTGTLNILEAVRTESPKTKVFVTGSGVQFKNTGNPISETDDFEANSAYSVSRIQSVYAARYYRSLGIKAYVGYLFHHESPMRKPHHVSKMIAEAVKRIDGGSKEKIEIGDLSVEKEWTFAGDVAKGMLTLVQQESVFEAVIGSGETHTIRDWVEACFEEIGKDWQQYVIEQDGFKAEYKKLVSSPKTMFHLGWRPEVGLKELARLMIQT